MRRECIRGEIERHLMSQAYSKVELVPVCRQSGRDRIVGLCCELAESLATPFIRVFQCSCAMASPLCPLQFALIARCWMHVSGTGGSAESVSYKCQHSDLADPFSFSVRV